MSFRPAGPKLTRWLFVVVFVLTFALGLVVHSAGGPWYGVIALAAMAVGSAYMAVFASDRVLLRVDHWIATIVHWSP
jgi:hypothetical protein